MTGRGLAAMWATCCGCAASLAEADRLPVQEAALGWLMGEHPADAACVEAGPIALEGLDEAAATGCSASDTDDAVLAEVLGERFGHVVPVSQCEPDTALDTEMCGGHLQDGGVPAALYEVSCPFEAEDGTAQVAVIWRQCDLSASFYLCTMRRGLSGWQVKECHEFGSA